MQYTIKPFRYQGVWSFEDPNTGKSLDDNMLVEGMDKILDYLAKHMMIDTLTFSEEPIASPAEFAMTLDWVRGDVHNVDRTGNYYRNEFGMEGWLCPVLFEYFEEAPKNIYIAINMKKADD